MEGSRRLDAVVAVALGLVVAATRWAYRGEGLFSWDSGLLASGVVSFDFASAHPHPPYYPIAIALAKLVAPWTGPAGSLVLWSVLASGVLAAFTWLVARRFLSRPAALVAAALVALSPTSLANGAVALTYAMEGASSAIVAWAAWACRRTPSPRSAATLAVVTSVAIGIRPSSLFLLAPLALWAVWGRGRAMAWGLGTGAGATLVWAVPMLVAGGGLSDFLAGNRYQSRHVVFAHTFLQDGWSVVPANLHSLGTYVSFERSFLAAFAVVSLVTILLWVRHRPRGALPFLAAWLVPSALFFTFVYAGWPVYPTGYVMVVLPAFAVLIATVLESLVRGLYEVRAPGAANAVVAVALAAVLAAPIAWPGSWHEATGGQREADAWTDSWWALEEAYPPNETAVLTFYGWFWARLDHPEYLTWGTLPLWNATGAVRVHVIEGQGGHEDRKLYEEAIAGHDDPPRHPIPAWVKQVVLVYAPPSRGDPYPLKPELAVENVTLESGMRVSVLDPTGLDTIEQAIRWFDDDGGLLE